MRWMLTLTVLAVAVVATGCENGQQNSESMRVPPPSYEAGEPEPMPAEASANEGDAVAATEEGASAPATAPAPEPEPMDDGADDGASTYTVQENDTLWSIAEDVYGDGQKWTEIVRANPGLDPENMSVGQEITLP